MLYIDSDPCIFTILWNDLVFEKHQPYKVDHTKKHCADLKLY